jgi:hypothetical protein
MASSDINPPPNALATDIGVLRLFGYADIADRGIGQGWSPREDGHNWNDGLDTSLTLWTDHVPPEPCAIMIEGSPYLPKAIAEQRMTLYVNGFRLGYWSMSENRSYTLQATIEPEFWLHRNDGGMLKITWHLPDSVKPIDIGDAEDHRQLGFCFRTLMLEAQPV